MSTAFTYQDNLQTPRLTTRFLTAADIVAWAPFFDDAEATAFFPPIPFATSEEKARWWIERQLTRYRENRLGLQALIHRQTGELVGQCGLLTQEVDGVEEIEVAYDVFKKWWGQGFATEGASAFINYAFQNHLTDAVTAIIDTRNTKAQRVAEKNNMQKDKQTLWAGHDVYIYRVRKEDYNIQNTH